MARGKSKVDQPREKLNDCYYDNCLAQLRNSDLPQHYLKVHKQDTGKFECNGCNFQCSFSDICILNHIEEDHVDEKVEASFNPLNDPSNPRIINKHTDQCGINMRKVKARKVPRKIIQGISPTVAAMETVTVSMISQARAAVPTGNMNSPNEVVRAKKSRVSINSNSADKRRNDAEQSDVEATPKRRKEMQDGATSSYEANTPADTPRTARSKAQAEKGRGKKSNRVNKTPEVSTREVREAVISENNDAATENIARQIPEDVETEPIAGSSGSSGLNSDDSDDDADDTVYDAESDQEQITSPPIQVEEAQLPRAEIKRRRVEKDKKAFIESFIKAHISYSYYEFNDLILELLEKWTDEPEQTTEELIENIGGRNPHVMFLREMNCPENIGDESCVDVAHECVVASSDKLHIHFVQFLITSSQRFKAELARKIWKTLVMRAAEYRFEEQIKVDEEVLKQKMLALRVLCDAYKKAAE